MSAETLPCQQCGGEFAANIYELKRGGGQFCSPACYHKSQRRRVQCTCEVCGAPFEVQSHRAALGRGHYCGTDCRAKGRMRRARQIDRVVARFWAKVERSDGCWLYTGHRDPGGYGLFWRDGRNTRAHVFAWELANGPLDTGQIICHRCDNPPCVRPEHLFAGSITDNIVDKLTKGRQSRHEHHAKAKLTWDKVRTIRARYLAGGVTMPQLATEYGVALNAIWSLLHHVTWKEHGHQHDQAR